MADFLQEELSFAVQEPFVDLFVKNERKTMPNLMT